MACDLLVENLNESLDDFLSSYVAQVVGSVGCPAVDDWRQQLIFWGCPVDLLGCMEYIAVDESVA